MQISSMLTINTVSAIIDYLLLGVSSHNYTDFYDYMVRLKKTISLRCAYGQGTNSIV